MAEVVRITVPAGAAMAEVTCFEARHYVSSLPRHLRHWDRMAKVWPVALRITRIPPVSTVQGGYLPWSPATRCGTPFGCYARSRHLSSLKGGMPGSLIR